MSLSDKGTFFDDLKTLSLKLPQETSTIFNCLFLPLYLKLINNELLNRSVNTGIKYRLIKLLHYFLFKKELNKKHFENGILVFVTETNHLQQIVPTTKLLREKYAITYISNKKYVLENPLLNGYDKLQLYLPSTQNSNIKQRKIFEKTLEEIFANTPLRKLNNKSIPVIADVFCNNLLYIRKLKKNWYNIINKLKPKAVIIGYDIPPEARTLVELSNEKKIPTIMIQHGAIAKVDGIFGAHLCKTILVYGDIAKQVLDESGCKSDVKITGATYLDNILNRQQSIQKLNDNKLKVLVAFSGPGHLTSLSHHQESISVLTEIAKKYVNNVEFFCKLHPKDNLSYYSSIVNNKQSNNIFFSLPHDTHNNNIFDWIDFCDIVLTGASTVAVEAMLFHKPTISIDLTGEYKDVTFNKEGAVKYVTSKGELDEIIKTATEGNFELFSSIKPKANEYKKRLFGPTDGKSAQRCSIIIEELISARNN
jgi:hypothetical protein